MVFRRPSFTDLCDNRDVDRWTWESLEATLTLCDWRDKDRTDAGESNPDAILPRLSGDNKYWCGVNASRWSETSWTMLLFCFDEEAVVSSRFKKQWMDSLTLKTEIWPGSYNQNTEKQYFESLLRSITMRRIRRKPPEQLEHIN